MPPYGRVDLGGPDSYDPEGAAVTFTWTQIGGALATLSDATAARPIVTVPAVPGDLTFKLEVSDGTYAGVDVTTISVRSPDLVLQRGLLRFGEDPGAPDDSLSLSGSFALEAGGVFDPTQTGAWLLIDGGRGELLSLSVPADLFTANRRRTRFRYDRRTAADLARKDGIRALTFSVKRDTVTFRASFRDFDFAARPTPLPATPEALTIAVRAGHVHAVTETPFEAVGGDRLRVLR